MTTNKTKSFTLESGYEGGFGYSVITTIFSNGSFHGKGDFQIQNYVLKNKKYPKKLFNVPSGYEKGLYWEFSVSISDKGIVYISLSPFMTNMYTYQSYKDGQKRCHARRNRKLGFHKISFPLDVEYNWHHVNTNDVVAISRYIHRAIRHDLKIKNCLEGVIG